MDPIADTDLGPHAATLLSSLPRLRALGASSRHSVGLMAALAAEVGCHVDQIAAGSLELFGVRALGSVPIAGVSPEFEKISFPDCVTNNFLPFSHDGTLKVVVSDPWNEQQRQWLAVRLGTLPPLLWADAQAIRSALSTAENKLRAMRERAPADAGRRVDDIADVDPDQLVTDISLESIERAASAVVRFVDAAIYDAWKSAASDIHFEGFRGGMRVMLRLDGVLVEGARMDNLARSEEVISRIKVLAQLDITERRVPQDGRFRVRLGGRTIDFRVSIMPSLHGEDAVLRLLDKTHLRPESQRQGEEGMRASSQPISLEGLGFELANLVAIRRLARRPNGMLLVTGPTGSGKTTTLYAVIQEIHTGREKIITIEDPVEYELEGVLQIPVNEKKGLTFARGLRSILRHDPDKILVGEIRDAETADIAVQAALTGHLVFTTVHANNVYDVVGRFLHMDVDLYSFMSALNGVVAQRLLRLNCPHCSVPVDPHTIDPADFERLAGQKAEPGTWRLHRGTGCEHCRETGFKGRMAVAEVLVVDDVLRSLVVRRAPIDEIKAHGTKKGASSLVDHATLLVLTGKTTIEEVDRVVAID